MGIFWQINFCLLQDILDYSVFILKSALTDSDLNKNQFLEKFGMDPWPGLDPFLTTLPSLLLP